MRFIALRGTASPWIERDVRISCRKARPFFPLIFQPACRVPSPPLGPSFPSCSFFPLLQGLPLFVSYGLSLFALDFAFPPHSCRSSSSFVTAHLLSLVRVRADFSFRRIVDFSLRIFDVFDFPGRYSIEISRGSFFSSSSCYLSPFSAALSPDSFFRPLNSLP